MSRHGFDFTPSGGEDLPGPATVKWFNAIKGFGFVSPSSGGADAFLHASVLSRAGVAELAEGQEIVCVIGQGAKGPQVLRILEVRGGGIPIPPRRERPAFDDAPAGPETAMDGIVKWFKPDKGFGFVTPDDGEKDVFVHMNVMRRCGVQMLDSGQRVAMKVVATPKGREATWVEILD